MVSGFVTSPDDHASMRSGDASVKRNPFHASCLLANRLERGDGLVRVIEPCLPAGGRKEKLFRGVNAISKIIMLSVPAADSAIQHQAPVRGFGW